MRDKGLITFVIVLGVVFITAVGIQEEVKLINYMIAHVELAWYLAGILSAVAFWLLYRFVIWLRDRRQ